MRLARDNEGKRRLKELIADTNAAGKRLDQWLAAELGPELSRSRVQSLITEGHVTLDGSPVHETKQKLREGMKITVRLPEPQAAEPEAENIPLDILYEDEDLIVVNKPAGLVVHPGNGNWTGTLVNALIYHCGDSLSGIGGIKRPGIVHRLDKDTSGVLVVAKNDHAHRHLSQQFADHGRTGDLERAYLALIWGMTERPQGTIETYLARSHRDRTKQAVVNENRADARHAITHYATMEVYGSRQDATALASLVECRLETGRTHQIRVHMAHLGNPLVGDMDYGSAYKTKANKLAAPLQETVRGFARQALHARLLAFTHPVTEKTMRFETHLPKDMADLVEQFRIHSS